MPKKTKEINLEFRYSGCLSDSKTIYLHYGIGDNWENISECKMRKLKNGFKTEITIPNNVTLRFCFRDANNNWDNNFGQDYSYNSFDEISYESVQVIPYEIQKQNKK